MPTKRPADGRQGRAELIKKVIKRLIASPDELAEALGHLQTGDIASAFEAGKDAIEALKPERCDRLRPDEVAVLIDRGERRTVFLLADSFRPNSPDGYTLMKLKDQKILVAGDASSRGGNRKPYFVYKRGPINAWWEEYEDEKTKNQVKGALNSWKVERVTILQKIEALQRKLARGEAIHGCQFAFVVNEHDQIIDNLALPIHESGEIAAHLQIGGRVEHLTLTEAMTAWTWISDSGAYDAWFWVWESRIEQEKARLEALHLCAQKIHADGRVISLDRLAEKRASGDSPGRKRGRS